MEKTTWKCSECGQIVTAARTVVKKEPPSFKWTDGHVCKFEEVKE